MEIISAEGFQLHKPTAVTIGNFDGFHAGHKRVIASLLEHSRELGLTRAILTFTPHPAAFFHRSEPRSVLLTREEKNMLAEDAGFDVFIEYPFTQETADMEPETFITGVLINKVNARLVTVGEGFRFGRRSAGDITELRRLALSAGFQVDAVPELYENDKKISTTIIKELISAGNLTRAGEYLTYPYFFSGFFLPGDKPCLELSDEKIMPQNGEYHVKITLNGKIYRGTANIVGRRVALSAQGLPDVSAGERVTAAFAASASL